MPTIPAKINPDDWADDDRLYALNNFRSYLTTLSKRPGKSKTAADGIKVVDCLRFIKVNEAFISYAFKNPKDKDIYTFTKDQESGSLRDFSNTAFHINLYHDDNKTPEECLKTCLEDLQNNISQFEDAINVAVKFSKLSEFTSKLTYDEETGCLAQRTLPAQVYAKELETSVESNRVKEFLYFEELMNQVAANFSPDDEDQNYQMVYDFFEPYIGKWCRYQKSAEIEISYEFIIKYMCDVLVHQPPKVFPGKKYYEEYIGNQAVQKALKLSHQERALVKVIDTSITDNSNIDFNLKQLKDPAKQRPVPRYDATGVDRTKYWDPRDQKTKTRIGNFTRGLPKRPDWKFTKKTSTTLLPTNSKINFYDPNDKTIGFLFDIDLCDIKNGKYVWTENVSSNTRWWLLENGKRVAGCTLEELRQDLRDKVKDGKLPNNNEIMACLSQAALTAVFAAIDTPAGRLNALRIKYKIKEELGLDLPVLIITPKSGSRAYTKKEMLADMTLERTNPAAITQKILAAMIDDPIALISQLQQEVIIEEKALTYANTIKNIFQKHLDAKQFDLALEMLNRDSESFVIDQDTALKENAMFIAITNQQPTLGGKLLSMGVKPDATFTVRNEKTTLLTLAFENNQEQILDEMLTKPLAEATLANCLRKAIIANNTQTVAKISSHKLNCAQYYMSETRESYMTLAIKTMNESIIRMVSAKGGNPIHADKRGLTAIDYLLQMEIPNKFDLLVMLLKNPLVTPIVLSETIAKIIINKPPNNLPQIEYLVKLMEIFANNFTNTNIAFFLDTAEKERQAKVVAKLLARDNDYYDSKHKYMTSFEGFVNQVNKYFNDEDSAMILEEIKSSPRMSKIHLSDINKAITQSIFAEKPILARALVNISPSYDKTLLNFLLDRKQYELVIQMIDSGKLSKELLVVALQSLFKANLTEELELKSFESQAKVYQKNIDSIINELHQYISEVNNRNAPAPSNFSFFKQENPAATVNAIQKLIMQFQGEDYQAFSTDEISSLHNSKLNAVLKNYQKVQLFPVLLFKTHTQSELDKIIQSLRHTGKTPQETLANTINAIEVDLRQQEDQLKQRIVTASRLISKKEIADKLMTIKSALSSLTDFGKNRILLPSLINKITQARDQARAIKPASTWTYIISGIKNLFGKHYGDSTTAKTLNNALNDINKLKGNSALNTILSIPSITQRDLDSSLNSANRAEILLEFNEKLTEVNNADLSQVITKIKEAFYVLDKANPNNGIIDFRKTMHDLYASIKGHPESQRIVHDALITAAIAEPLNNDNSDPLTLNLLSDVSPNSIIYLSDGYFFEIEPLVEWIKVRGLMQNPVTRVDFLEEDIINLKNKALELNIDLSNLDPTQYHVEDDPSLLAEAILIAQGQPSAGQALQSFSHFRATAPFIQILAETINQPVADLIKLQAEHPYQFTRVSNVALYIKEGILTIDQAIKLSPDQSEDLALLALTQSNLAPEEFAAQVTAILSAPNNRNNP